MKKDEKKRVNKIRAADFFHGLGDEVKNGELNTGKGVIHIPDNLTLSVEYSEKKEKKRLKIKLKWRGESEEAVKPIVAAKPTAQRPDSTKNNSSNVKKSMKKVYNNLLADITSGNLPAQKEAEEFMVLGGEFLNNSRGRAFEEELNDFMELVKDLDSAVKRGDHRILPTIMDEMMVAKKRCHKIHIKKD